MVGDIDFLFYFKKGIKALVNNLKPHNLLGWCSERCFWTWSCGLLTDIFQLVGQLDQVHKNLFGSRSATRSSSNSKLHHALYLPIYIFLTTCWRSLSRSQIESYLFATAWEISSAQWLNFPWFSWFVCVFYW